MKKRTVIITALALAGAMVFSGCKKQEPTDDVVTEDPAEGEDEGEQEEEPEEPEEDPQEGSDDSNCESYITSDEVTYGINDLELDFAEEEDAEGAVFAQENGIGTVPYKLTAKRDISNIFVVKLAYDEEGIVQGDELICNLDGMKAGEYIYLTEIIPEGMPCLQITWTQGTPEGTKEESADGTPESTAEESPDDTPESTAEESADGTPAAEAENTAEGTSDENSTEAAVEHTRLISQSGLDGSLLLVYDDENEEYSFTESKVDTEGFKEALRSCIGWGGDAGSSLQAVQAAANLLTWTAENPTYAINTRVAFEKFWFDLTEEEKQNFHDNWYNSVMSCGDEMSQTLTVDGIEDDAKTDIILKMEDAGVTDQVKAAQENGDLETMWPMLVEWIDSYLKTEA